MGAASIHQQGLDNSRILLQGLFAAGIAQPVQNPRQRGFGSTDRLDKIVLCFDGTAVEPGAQANLTFATMNQYLSFFTAWLQQIQFNSGAMPDMVDQQPLVDLVLNLIHSDGVVATGLPDLGVPIPTPGGVFTFNVRLEISYVAAQQAKVLAAHAPFMGWLFDGGLNVQFGNGNIQSSAGVYAIPATAQFTARVEYTSGAPLLKVAPYNHMRRTFQQLTGNTLPIGVYYALSRLGTPPNLPALIPQGIDSGIDVTIDGETAMPFRELDPITNVNAWLQGLPGCGGPVRELTRLGLDAAALSMGGVNGLPIYPIINNPVDTTQSDRPEVSSNLTLDFGNNLPVACIVVGKRTPFIDKIGEGQDACDCTNKQLRAIPFPLAPGVASPVLTKDLQPKGLRSAPRLVVNR